MNRTARRVVKRLGSFSAVGTVAFIVDVSLFNLLNETVLQGNPVTAKIFSVIAATTVSWLGSRYLTFRHTRGRSLRSETFLFALTNAVGLLISAGCLVVSNYVFGWTGPVADNISGNVVGVALGNVFRYFAYRYIVFNAPRSAPADATEPSRVSSRR